MGAIGPHFSEAELRCRGKDCAFGGGHGCGVNGSTQGLVDALEAIRAKAVIAWCAKFQKPESEFPGMRIHDAFRCLRHNIKTTGAAKDSQHPNGRAADYSVDGLTAAELEAITRTVPEVHGIGRDDARNFVHADVRPGLTLATWCYDDGKWCRYFPPPQQT